MSLIQCKDCGAEISSSAAACPQCGAPVPVTVGPDQEQCPWCMTVMSKGATVCPSCRAQKGYYTTAKYGVMGKGATVTLLVLAILAGLLLAAIFWPLSVLFGIGALGCAYYLIRGPRWFQSRHPG